MVAVLGMVHPPASILIIIKCSTEPKGVVSKQLKNSYAFMARPLRKVARHIIAVKVDSTYIDDCTASFMKASSFARLVVRKHLRLHGLLY